MISTTPVPVHKIQKTILVVDDDASLRELTEFWLVSDGFEVVTAKNGSEAIDRLKSVKEINLILLDVQMPVMNGNEVLNEMRIGGFLESTPVVILSATHQPKGLGEVFRELLKPVSRLHLLTCIQECLREKIDRSA
jgi:CheY-like chemotaxis protein